MKKMNVAVIAGAIKDTQMGVDFLCEKGINALGYSVSASPEEQSKLQILSPVELRNKIIDIIKQIKKESINIIMVYCNSLSTAVDMEELSKQENIKIITPLTVYKEIADKYKNIGVLAANNQSTAGIERVIQSVNPACNVIGMGILPVVIDIENGLLPKKIIEKFGLRNIIEFYNTINSDVIILGCTHFPYLHRELIKFSSMPILDPAELMYSMILNS